MGGVCWRPLGKPAENRIRISLLRCEGNICGSRRTIEYEGKRQIGAAQACPMNPTSVGHCRKYTLARLANLLPGARFNSLHPPKNVPKGPTCAQSSAQDDIAPSKLHSTGLPCHPSGLGPKPQLRPQRKPLAANPFSHGSPWRAYHAKREKGIGGAPIIDLLLGGLAGGYTILSYPHGATPMTTL